MRHVLAAALFAALAGCGGAQDNTPQAACQRQAYNDPVVKRLMLLRMSNPADNFNLDTPYQQAVQQATEHCLTAHGLAPAGGVAPVVRQY